VSAGSVVGRDAELVVVEEFLDALSGGPAALVVEGEPGIGKTTVWQAAVRRAEERETRVLVSRPGASEARLTFVGLTDLLSGVEDEVFDELPGPQRRALDVALLRADPEEVSSGQRVVATAFMSVLRTLSSSLPVVVAIDDLQWLDTPSWGVLEFALRRLETEPVGVVSAVRLERGESAQRSLGRFASQNRIRRVRLGPLNLAALHEILRAELGCTFPRPTLVRIERTSSGNPFFALELARAILERGEPVVGSAALPVPEDLVELLERRLRRLSAACRQALLVASALTQPTLELVDRDAVALAEDAGVVRVDERGRVAFTHPLLASAVYSSASVARRREVHRELARRVTDAEERARHLALATDEPDEDVAATLVEAARSARARGAPDSAIELFGLGSELTPGHLPDTRHARMFELAQCLAAAGDPQRAADVLREVVAEARFGLLRAKARVILAFLLEWEGTEEAVRLCEQALVDAGDDADLRAEIHAVTSRICDYDTERKVFHARAAHDLVESRTLDPRLHGYVLLAVAEAEFHAGGGIAHEVFERAAALESAAAASPGGPESLLGALHGHSGLPLSARLLSVCQLDVDELDPARAVFEKELRVASDEGDESQVARTLWRLATVELKAGNWALAEEHLRELDGVVDRTGQEGVGCKGLTIKARLDTLRGRVDEARKAGEQALGLAVEGGDEWLVAESLAALGFLELSAGNLEAARAHLDAVDEIYARIGLGEPALLRHHADHIESLIGLGELELADAALGRLEEQARATQRAWALAAGARCRGLLLSARGDLDGAATTLDQALTEHARLPIPFERGRTLLVKGQIHRRRNERRLAREALLESIAVFEELGAPLWAEKARAELRRTGLRRGARGELTPTEETVASLAASGLTNRQIAERVFVSPKTVEANLARVYRKLGIRSRAELGARMTERKRPTET
jgi:DNA-binding CsgD family transcriptional regulator